MYICNTLEEKYQQEKIDISKSDQLINNEMIIKKGKRKIQNNIEILLNSVKEEKDKENYDLKHDLITADMKIESLEAQLQEAKDKNIELQKEIVKLQTELKNKK